MSLIHHSFESWLGNRDERQQLSTLSKLLEISPQQTREITSNRRLGYQTYQIKKRHGYVREICAPTGDLKKLQRKLLANYFSSLLVHYSCCAFRKGVTIKNHALIHSYSSFILTVDLKNFFSSTRTSRVQKYFSEQGWSGHALQVLKKLTCYRGSLPQGAPTSPILSNLVNYELDVALQDLAQQTRATYSRYCDDLAFSWQTGNEPVTFRSQAEGLLNRFGYQVQREKGWKVQKLCDRPELTGIKIKSGFNLAPAEKTTNEIKRLKRKRKKSDKEYQRLVGLLAFKKFLKH